MGSFNFVVFILTHGRADNVVTYKTLRDQGYTGRIVLVVDDEDGQLDKYIDRYGKDDVAVFSKAEQAQTFDEVLKGDRRTIVYARNACFDIAKRMGVDYFLELDDDYMFFSYVFLRADGTPIVREKNTLMLDEIFSDTVAYLAEAEQVATIAYSQGGDYIGGVTELNAQRPKRKAMNSFFCATARPFKFIGRINEDVNTYTSEASKGLVMFQLPFFSINQKMTQTNKGGMTDVYLDSGTYIKSFFSIIVHPSAVKIGLMGGHEKRLHHSITWKYCVPKIIDEKYRKT